MEADATAVASTLKKTSLLLTVAQADVDLDWAHAWLLLLQMYGPIFVLELSDPTFTLRLLEGPPDNETEKLCEVPR